MTDSQPHDHTVTVLNPSEGFAPAQLCTTTYGIEYLLQALRNNSPEAPDMALHEILVTRLNAALTAPGGQPQDVLGLRMTVLSLRAMQAQIRQVVEGSLSWEDKYALIFSDRASKRVYDLFKEAGLAFNPYDPDGDYEDDVRAFADGLDSRLRELTDFFSPA